jgi:hypothetical protein
MASPPTSAGEAPPHHRGRALRRLPEAAGVDLSPSQARQYGAPVRAVLEDLVVPQAPAVRAAAEGVQCVLGLQVHGPSVGAADSAARAIQAAHQPSGSSGRCTAQES